MEKNPKRPRDPNQLAKMIVDLATGEISGNTHPKGKNQDAVALGKKGGKARASKLSPEKRKEIARKAAAKRWEKESE